MSFNFSISGHADTQEKEWALIQSLASAAQQAGASTANGSTQFHGLVDLLRVQAGANDEIGVAGTDEASTVTPAPVLNEAGEIVGFGSASPAPETEAAAAIQAPPAAPVEAEPVQVTAETPGAVTNAAGEVVGTAAPDSGTAPTQTETAAPAQSDVVDTAGGSVDPTKPVHSEAPPGLRPIYNKSGEILGYVEP